jgi:hypothetical protein
MKKLLLIAVLLAVPQMQAMQMNDKSTVSTKKTHSCSEACCKVTKGLCGIAATWYVMRSMLENGNMPSEPVTGGALPLGSFMRTKSEPKGLWCVIPARVPEEDCTLQDAERAFKEKREAEQRCNDLDMIYISDMKDKESILRHRKETGIADYQEELLQEIEQRKKESHECLVKRLTGMYTEDEHEYYL